MWEETALEQQQKKKDVVGDRCHRDSKKFRATILLFLIKQTKQMSTKEEHTVHHIKA